MPSGCTKCPRCGNDPLQPYPARGRAYCLRAADCGYSEDIEPDLRAQVAALVGALERRTPDNPYESGGTCSFCGSYDSHHSSCSWQQARTLLANLPDAARDILCRAQAHDDMAAEYERFVAQNLGDYLNAVGLGVAAWKTYASYVEGRYALIQVLGDQLYEEEREVERLREELVSCQVFLAAPATKAERTAKKREIVDALAGKEPE